MAQLIDAADGRSPRLADLLARYDAARAAADAAAAELKQIADGIKAETAARLPEGATEARVDAPGLSRPLRLMAVVSWRVDTAKLRAEAPETYARCARQSTSWRLDRVGA